MTACARAAMTSGAIAFAHVGKTVLVRRNLGISLVHIAWSARDWGRFRKKRMQRIAALCVTDVRAIVGHSHGR
jgi:hypothetical protein